MKTLGYITMSAVVALLSVSAHAQTAPNDPKDNPTLPDGQLAVLGAFVNGDNKPATQSSAPRQPGTLPSIAGDSDGAIAKGNLTVKDNRTSEVNLTGQSQSAAEAVNIVNSSSSQVANGVNTSADGFAAQAIGGLIPIAIQTNTNTDQDNAIGQFANGGATLGEYSTYTSTKTVDTSSSSDVSSDVEVGSATFNVNNNKVQTASGAAGGHGFDTDIGSGNVNFDDTFTTKAGALFGLIEGEVTVTSGYDKATPSVSAASDAPGCAVSDGTCSANGKQIEESTRTEELESAPVSQIKNWSADYIALGDANIEIGSNAVVSLADNAQSAAKGVNIVNASNSQVANGANISAKNGLSMASGVNANTTQTNIIIQR